MDKKKWVKHIPLFIVEVLVLIIAVAALFVILRTTGENGVKKAKIDEDKIAVNEEIKEKVTENTQSDEVSEYTGIYNIAFFGVDARDENLGKGDNRSDTIMICSVDMDKHEVRLISIYRDTYLNVGNDSYGKCNKAYALGGPEQALSMINMNTDLYVTDYITVGFDGLMEAVDALGGVDIDVREEEISHLNNYQISMVGKTSDGKTYTADAGTDYIPVTTAGRQVLNGLQATAYCRIRYVGDDFQRTQRQRTVLLAIAEKAKKASPATLNKIANDVFDEIYTSLDLSEIVELLGEVSKYEVVGQGGFPEESMRATGTIGSKGSCVVPKSLADNVTWLHQFLFDDNNYTPSAEVQSYSEKIAADAGSYVN